MSKKAPKSKAPAKKPAAKKAAPVVTTVSKLEVRNGVTQPGEGTACRKVWTALDKLVKAGKEPTAGNAFDHLKDVNPATVRTQVQRFRTFHGIKRDAKKPARKSSKPAEPAVVSAEVQA